MPNLSYASEAGPTTLLITFTDIKESHDFVNYFTYDPITNKEESLGFRRRVETMYPTGVLTKDRKNLYINRLESTDGKSYIGLYSWALPPLSGQGPKQLTNRSKITNVDHLRYNNNKSLVYMRVVQPNHRNAQLATYDVASKKTTVWNAQDSTIEVQNFDYTPVTDQVISLEFSLVEETANIVEANEEESPLRPPTFHIVLYDSSGQKIREVASIKKHILDISFSPDAKTALLTATDQYNAGSKYSVYSLDLTSGEVTTVFKETDQFTKIKQAQYSPDGKKIYFLTVKRDTLPLSNQPGRRVRPRSIAAYNVATQEFSDVWKKEKGTINNFLVID